jgi:hypothetical protein
VPFKVIVVPTAAPTAIVAGVIEVIAGPATENALSKGALCAEPFEMTTLSGPAVAPVEATVKLNDAEVPALLFALESETPPAAVVLVPT